ncbi:PREDICTED: F-box/LRR-repeat protein 19-like [Thamnophis sirtalis]|uniref:F-box/LRR-repeat protein 19-like n=1 Tax=Thamnophis sirtalis TaxID=35019 RepID=A0A6I9YRI8_9SAUR|nr:PREDICTED: F-box/LRR-repeat protein 19-like [Thamnophis sirtalis]
MPSEGILLVAYSAESDGKMRIYAQHVSQFLHLFCPPSQDSGDGIGKRRSDNGEEGVRWKLTDEPAQNKKKLPPAPPLPPPPSEESPVQTGAHKRKKELPAPETGPKKKLKGTREIFLKKGTEQPLGNKLDSMQTWSRMGGSDFEVKGTISNPSIHLSQITASDLEKPKEPPLEPSAQTDKSHQREKLERFKQMCQMLERVKNSSSSSSKYSIK